TGNGDVLTDQQWCNGRTLEESEIMSSDIAEILVKIHQSDTLKRLFKRVGGEEVSAVDLLMEYELNLSGDLENHPVLQEAYKFLLNSLPLGYTENDIRVCHADISNDNMLLSVDVVLYIVDWDMAVLKDYFFDFGF